MMQKRVSLNWICFLRCTSYCKFCWIAVGSFYQDIHDIMRTMQKGKQNRELYTYLKNSFDWSYKLGKRVMLWYSVKFNKHKWINDITRHVLTESKCFILKQNIIHEFPLTEYVSCDVVSKKSIASIAFGNVH